MPEISAKNWLKISSKIKYQTEKAVKSGVS